MEFYYTFHILLFATCIVDFFRRKSVKKIALIGWCAFFVLIGGLRWRIGGDWDQYLGHFTYSSWSNIFNYDRYGNGNDTLEPFFVFINVAIKSIFHKFYWYNILECLFIQFSLYKLCWRFGGRYPVVLYSWMMLALVNYFPVRSGLSCAVCYWAFKYIQERKFVPFFCIVGIASLIHNQCFVLLPFYFAGYLKLSVKHYAGILIVVSLLTTFFQENSVAVARMLGGKAGLAYKLLVYTDINGDNAKNFSVVSCAFQLLLIALAVYVREVEKKTNDYFINALLNMSIVCTCFFVVFSSTMSELTRLTAPLTPAVSILYIYSLSHFWNSGKKWNCVAALLFFCAYYVYRLTQVGTGYYFHMTCVPYKTIFDYLGVI